MSSLFSSPKSPDPVPMASPAPPAPPAPLPPAPPPPLPTASLAPLPAIATDPALAARIDPTVAAANALAMRGRGIQGTIATSLAGVPAAAAMAGEALSAGADFSANARLPQRKTLLGE